MATAGSQNQFLIIVVVLVFIVLVRVRRVINGTRVSLARTIGFSAYYVAFASLFVYYSYTEGVPLDYFTVYTAVFAASAFVSYRTAGDHLQFWRDQNGSIFSKGGMVIYIVYIVGLIARIVIGYVFVGPAAFGFSTVPVKLSSTGNAATIVTDLLLVSGAGLLFGRNMRILKRYSAIKRGEEQLALGAKNWSGV